MNKIELEKMDVEGLLTLQSQVETALSSKREELQAQLGRLGMGNEMSPQRRGGRGNGRGAPGRTSAMKGIKIAAKYRGPDGETWAGRGAKPRWLVAATKKGSGKKLDDFLIDKKRKTMTK